MTNIEKIHEFLIEERNAYYVKALNDLKNVINCVDCVDKKVFPFLWSSERIINTIDNMIKAREEMNNDK